MFYDFVPRLESVPDYYEDTFQCVRLGKLDICINCAHCVNRGMVGNHCYYFCDINNEFTFANLKDSSIKP